MTSGVSPADLPPLPEVDPLFENMQFLDETRAACFESMARYIRFPIARNGKRFTDSINELAYAFYASANTIVTSDADVLTKSQMLATLLLSEDEQRVSFLTETTGDNTFSPNQMNRPTLAGLLLEDLEDSITSIPSLTGRVLECFVDNFEADIDKMHEYIKNTPTAQILHHSQRLGTRALQAAVTGITAGATYYFLQRKKKN